MELTRGLDSAPRRKHGPLHLGVIRAQRARGLTLRSRAKFPSPASSDGNDAASARGGDTRAVRNPPFATLGRNSIRVALVLGALLVPRVTARSSSEGELDILHARWWSIGSGLPQSSINDLLQSADGELWIATFGGLLRFDGVEFRTFDLGTLPGLDSIRVTALAPAGDRGIWFATQEGSVLRLEDGVLREREHVPGHEELLSIATSADGALWTQSTSGATHRFSDGAWSERLPRGPNGTYEGLCADRDGTLWAAAGRELVHFGRDAAELERLRAPARVVSISCGASGTWVGLSDGLARVTNGEIQRFAVEPRIVGGANALLDDGAGGLWVGTQRGSMYVTTESATPRRVTVDSGEPLPGGFDVRAMTRDREGNLWLGSASAGLMRLRRQPVQRALRGPRTTPVSALCDDGAGGAWVGLDARGLARMRSGSNELEPQVLDGVENERASVRALLLDQRQRLWVGIDGTWVRRESEFQPIFEPVLGGRTFRGRAGPMVETRAGEFWLSTNGGSLLHLDRDDRLLEHVELGFALHSLAAGDDGSVWVGGEGSVLHYHAGERTLFGAEQGIPPGSVRDLLLDPDGSVWIATYGGGLARLSGSRAQRISRSEGLPDSALTRMLDDGQGRLWLLSNLGLIVAPRDALDELLAGRRARIDPVLIGPEAGTNEANSGAPAGFRSPSGSLWFGTIGGPLRVDALDFPFNRVPPPPHIERLLADDHELAPGSSGVAGAQIAAGTRRFEFQFTAFALSASERVRFRYRLDGYDHDWVDAGAQRRAVYTGVWPGDYAFRVEARNEDGIWSAAPARLSIRVLPSWWQTSGFGVALLVALAAALFFVHRLRVRVLERRARAQLELTHARAAAEERESRLRDELAHVARVATAGELATSLAHEVNQPLAVISTNAQLGRRYVAREKLDREALDEVLREITQESQRASEVIRRLRDFLRKHAIERRRVALDDVVRATLPLVRRELADNRVELTVELAPALPAVDADPVQLQQVLVNLVRNACEALAASEGERRIRVLTCVRDGRVVVEVCDNGPGLAPELAGRLFEPFATTKSSGMGLGLAICRSIVEAHRGRLAAEPGSGNDPRGMVFRVELPPGQSPGQFEERSV